MIRITVTVANGQPGIEVRGTKDYKVAARVLLDAARFLAAHKPADEATPLLIVEGGIASVHQVRSDNATVPS